MDESNIAIVLDVLAQEIDTLRYHVKTIDKENAELRNKARVLESENAKLRSMIGEGSEKHE